jgi:hypothetical protein
VSQLLEIDPSNLSIEKRSSYKILLDLGLPVPIRAT